MILVPSHEMKKLTRSAAEPTVREAAKDDLDERMKAILEDPRLNSYEKVKRYESLLRRYLTLYKQGRDEESRVTFHLPPEEEQQQVQQQQQQVHHQEQQPGEEDEMVEEVLKSLPPRDRKNARYIMQKLAEGGGGGWTKRGEFVYKGDAVRGSHMIDLFKNLSLSFKSKNQTQPKGWKAFLTTLVESNIPSSSIHNRRAREEYACLKSDEEEEGGQTPARRGRKPARVKKLLSPTWTAI
ncbi:serine protease 57 [Sarotherodon galilaeus]